MKRGMMPITSPPAASAPFASERSSADHGADDASPESSTEPTGLLDDVDADPASDGEKTDSGSVSRFD